MAANGSNLGQHFQPPIDRNLKCDYDVDDETSISIIWGDSFQAWSQKQAEAKTFTLQTF